MLVLRVLLDEKSILVVDSLSDVGDELQVVLHLVFALFEVSCLVTFEALLFFEFLLHLDRFGLELSKNILLLLLLHLLPLRQNVLNRLMQFILQVLNSPPVVSLGILLIPQPDPELPLQLIDGLPVLALSGNVPVLPPLDVILDLLVLIIDLLQLDLDLTEPLVPLVGLDVVIRIVQVYARD